MADLGGLTPSSKPKHVFRMSSVSDILLYHLRHVH